MSVITILIIFHVATTVALLWPVAGQFMTLYEMGNRWNVIGGFLVVLLIASIPVYNVHRLFTRPPFEVRV